MKDEKIISLFKGYYQTEEYEDFYRERQPEDNEIERILSEFSEKVLPGECRHIEGEINDLVTQTGTWKEQMGFRMGFKYGFKLASEALTK